MTIRFFVAIVILSISSLIISCENTKNVIFSTDEPAEITTEMTAEIEIDEPVDPVPVEMTTEVTEPETPPYEMKPLYRDEIETDEIVTIWHDFDAYIESNELADYLIYAAGYNDRNCGKTRKESVDYLYIKTSNDEFNDKISEHVTKNHLDVLSDEIILRFLESFSPTVYFVVGIKPRCR